MPDNLGPLSDGGLSGVGDSPVVDNAAVGDTQPRSNNADAGPTGSRGSRDGILGRIGSGAGSLLYGGVAAGINGSRWAGRAMGMAWRKMLDMLGSAGLGISRMTGGLLTPRMGMVAAGGGGGIGSIWMVVTLVTLLFPHAKMDEPMILECQTQMNQADMSKAMGGESEEQDANAKKIFEAFVGMGMSPENAAGILGNWSTESGIDPTSVETFGGQEPYKIGPKKQRAWDLDFKLAKVDPGYKSTYPAIDLMGIGLGQWTNERNTMLLDFADANGEEWHVLELQLAFMLGGDAEPRIKVVEDMVDNKNPSSNSPGAAAMHFLKDWEGIVDHSAAKRTADAEKWFSKAKSEGWKGDKQLAESILKMADSGGSAANNEAMNDEVANCDVFGNDAVANSDIAEAAVSYAWGLPEDSKFNDGTDIYYWLHKEIFPDIPYFASCDAVVTTAVHWSGADKSFPGTFTGTQLKYLNGEGKEYWKKVAEGQWGDFHDKLEPGDVAIISDNPSSGHIFLYVGNEVVKKVWEPSGEKYQEDATVVSGSCGTRSAGLATQGDTTNSGDDGGNHLSIFRNIKKNPDKKETSLKPPSSMKMNKATGENKNMSPIPCA